MKHLWKMQKKTTHSKWSTGRGTEKQEMIRKQNEENEEESKNNNKNRHKMKNWRVRKKQKNKETNNKMKAMTV